MTTKVNLSKMFKIKNSLFNKTTNLLRGFFYFETTNCGSQLHVLIYLAIQNCPALFHLDNQVRFPKLKFLLTHFFLLYYKGAFFRVDSDCAY